MLKRRKVYICDMCGRIELPVVHLGLGVIWMPDNWKRRGKFDFCPDCDKVYRQLKCGAKMDGGKQDG